MTKSARAAQNVRNPHLSPALHTYNPHSQVPDELRAGYIGDNYVWKEDAANGATTYYVLSGSNVCPTGAAAWCGYAAQNATPQALLFSSPDLKSWKFVSQFWAGESPDGGKSLRVDTPETFPLPNGRQAFIWLNDHVGKTYWMVGALDRTTMKFTSTAAAMEDGGAFFCGQSLEGPLGRRVQFGWLKLNGLPGFTGAQSLPRQIIVDPSDPTGGGLWFRPLPEIWTLHSGAAITHVSPMFRAGTRVDITPLLAPLKRPLQMHLRFIVAIDATPGATGGGVAIDVLGGAAAKGATLTLTRSGAVTPSPTPNPTPAPTLPPTPRNCSAGGAPASGFDTVGTDVSLVAMKTSDVGMAGALKCRAFCCADPQCAAFTFSDPQPGSEGKVHDCWLKSAGAKVVPGGAGCKGTTPTSGHCWSGLVGGSGPSPAPGPPGPGPSPGPPPTDVLTLRVVGGGVNITMPLRARIDAAPGAIAAMLDVFVDGAIVEVFANDGEGVTALSLSDVTAATYALRVVGGASSVPNVTLTAWGMDASVE